MSAIGDKTMVNIPMFSIGNKPVWGDIHEDDREVHSNRAGHGGHIHVGPRGRQGTAGSTPERPAEDYSFRSVDSLGSAFSLGSIGSAGSILSIGSAGSILSIGSAGSILSIGSAGSVGPGGTIAGSTPTATPVVDAAATVLALAALAGAATRTFLR